MSDMAEELAKRMAQKPDQWTLAWWSSQLDEIRKAYRGVSHACNCATAEIADAGKSIKELCQRCEKIEADLASDRAKIGELQARVEHMADFLNKLKKEHKP